jgi:hypothetical protein
MMVAVCNLHVECGHCTVKQAYENVRKNAVKVTNEFRWPSLLYPSELWRILARVMTGTVRVTFGSINA